MLTMPVEICFVVVCNVTRSSSLHRCRSSHRNNMLLTSEQLPLAMFKKLMNFAEDPESNPSAMLFIILMLAR